MLAARKFLKTILTLLFLSLAFATNAEGIVIRAADKMILDSVSSHKMNYVFPVTYRQDQGNYEHSELIFQFSAKKMVFIENLYIAYTQQTFWEFLDEDNSRPIRESNFNPEVFYDFQPGTLPWATVGSSVGFEHESNGQTIKKSRSWDRFYIWPYWIHGANEFSLKAWVRRPQDRKKNRLDPRGDQNPDIYKYMGYGEFYFHHERKDKQSFSGMLRGNPRTGKAAVQLDYSWPLTVKGTYFTTRIFSGYGESLIDYRRSLDRISLGFTFRN